MDRHKIRKNLPIQVNVYDIVIISNIARDAGNMCRVHRQVIAHTTIEKFALPSLLANLVA